MRYRLGRHFYLLTVVIFLQLINFAQADIYQWEWIDPSHPELGKQQGTTLCPDGSGVIPAPNVSLNSMDLNQAYLIGADLNNAIGYNTNLTNADLSHAYLFNTKFNGSNLSGANLTQVSTQISSFFQMFPSADFSDVDLTNSNLNQATLNEALFYNSNLTNANLNQTNLNDAKLANTNLANADFTNAQIRGADFSTYTFFMSPFPTAIYSSDLTQVQLESTASYKEKDLSGIAIYKDMSGWDFHDQNLQVATFKFHFLFQSPFPDPPIELYIVSAFTGANFSGADLRGANYDSFQLEQANTTNTILKDGTIQGLNLSGGQSLTVHNSDIPIVVQSGMTMGTDGKLNVILDHNWGSTISFDTAIPASLGGTLQLSFVKKNDSSGKPTLSNVLGEIGQKFKLFDWSGVHPTRSFSVSSTYSWDLSQLYSTGDATLDYVMNASNTRWTGTKNGKWNDAGNWTAGVPEAESIIEFDSANPAHQPMIQNLANPLILSGIMFAPHAGEHFLSGPTLQLGSDTSAPFFSGDPSTVVCASANDQYIGNPLDLESNTIFVVSGSGDLTLGGEISGNGILTKRGSGKLILENSVTCQNGTTIEDGTLAIDTTGQIENSNIYNDATLQIIDGDHTVNFIYGNGTTEVLSGSLTAESIYQDSLVVGPGAVIRLNSSDATAGSKNLKVVPEPGSIALFGMGFVSLFVWNAFKCKRR